MKNKLLFSLLGLLFLTTIQAQVAVGKENIDGLGIIDFAPNLNRGIVLPYTTSIDSPTNGTFTFDIVSKKVKLFMNNNWINMTFEGSVPANYSFQTPANTNKVIIGATTSEANGVLILESNNRALILPKINDVTTIFKPASGTICYDLATDSLAVFNGIEWSFWK